MKSEIEQALEQIGKYYATCNNPYTITYADMDPNFNIIKQGFINLEIEYNKMKRRAGSHKESAIKFNTKLDEIRDLRNDYDPFIYEQLGIKVVRCNEIKRILDKE